MLFKDGIFYISLKVKLNSIFFIFNVTIDGKWYIDLKTPFVAILIF